MRKIFLLCILTLAGAPAAFSQEKAPMLDSGFGIKPFSDSDYVSPYTIKQSVDGGFYLGGEYGLLRLDAAGNKLWGVLYPTVESSGWLTSAEGNMAVDAADNVYTCINTYLWEPHILKYDSQGNLLKDHILSITSPDSDPAVFGVAYSSTSKRIYAAFSYWSSAREGYVAAIAMFDEDLNLIKNVEGPAGIDWGYNSVTGIGVDKDGNVYVGGSRTGSFIYVLKYDPGLNLLFTFAKDPIAPKMFISGETIPNGGYYIINNELVDNTLHNISASGVEQWFRPSGMDRYIHGVDGGGNFYGVDNSQTPQFSRLGYADGVVKWTMPEPHSVMIDAVFVDGQDRIYTAGYLAEPVGDKDSYIARYTQGVGDTTAPAQVLNLAVTAVSSNSVTLSWTAPGDDGLIGTASSYDLRYTTTGAITGDSEFNAAAQTQGEPAPQAAGGAETFTVAGLAPGTTYFFGLKAADEAGNISGLSNSPEGITLSGFRYAISKSTGDRQVGTVTKKALLPFTVKVVDADGVSVVGASVTFSTSSIPAGTAGYSLSVISTTTAGDGTASSLLTFGNKTGTYTVTAACDGCSPASLEFSAQARLFLKIELSTSSIKPVPFSQIVADENKVTLTVRAYGVQGSTDIVAGYPLVLVSSAVANSGGHDHDGNRPDGLLSGTGLEVFKSSSTGRTNADGDLFAVFTSTFFSGIEMFTASSTIDAGVSPAISTLTVKAGDFVLLPDSTNYIKDGGTCLHHGPEPKNKDGTPAPAECASPDRDHYATSAATSAIAAIAAEWLKIAPTRMLEVNDISLELGGGFDVGGGWSSDIVRNIVPPKIGCNKTGHCGHRDGTQVDIQVFANTGPKALPKTIRDKLARIIENHGGSKYVEGSHWHISF